MSWTYRHRKTLIMGAIAISVVLLVAAALYMLMQHADQQQKHQQMKEEYERQIYQLKTENEQNSRNVWTTAKTIPAGVALKADDLKSVPMPVSLVPPGVITDRESIIGKSAKIELESGTPLLSSLLYEGQPVPKDLRIQEFQVIQLPSNLKPHQYIDVRIGFPTGEDFVLLSKKKVQERSGTIVWLELDEMDILQTSSAIIDAYLQGARLYALPYIEPGLQDAAVVNYPANQKVLDLMAVDPNLLETAQIELARKLRQTLDGNLKAVSESDKLRVTSGNVTVQQQLQNERTTTRQGNAMSGTQPVSTPQAGESTVPTSGQQPAPGDSSATASSPPSTTSQQPSPPADSPLLPSGTPPATEAPLASGDKWEDIFNQ
ncbi:flagellar basal body P-ring biosynthesis protein FlgA [Paenibacillus darwinianus]|uniref:Flagellar basal body P-ring biosynthesis protein FlgA n=3 Tax=Paenibacillus darwinianus TaxID=1380763 RepID=A0A9W5W672_9BACL|nr:SAF domain-containing protein [Paenibacillus darwinianus]EXX85705.1 flagellar basal body P-ring biosynthesis protein FlgA [Paenibacillus darwinianus]EXX87031.1 flagellar basal body P-ring biosynthesis protein FlgA [Paenibacillus darwinianus]EXX88936.1 flagellar basal body P-ring biosynthesis protein FlgA [Paenibacillus darwinianus]